VADRPGITYDAIHLNTTGTALMTSLVKDAVDGIGRLEKGHELAIDVAGRPDVPDDATAAVLNVTTTTGHALGFVTAYPCGEAAPDTSNANFVPLATAANLVVSRLGNGRCASPRAGRTSSPIRRLLPGRQRSIGDEAHDCRHPRPGGATASRRRAHGSGDDGGQRRPALAPPCST
jgi:hypothetical protein